MTKVVEQKFQSYLITGNELDRERETLALLTGLNIDLKTSPDIFIIQGQKGVDSQVPISEIRNLKSHIFQMPVQLKYKIIIIKNAHNLTQEAQSALLKIFEEPPTHAIIILEASSPKNLLPTIVSRAVV